MTGWDRTKWEGGLWHDHEAAVNLAESAEDLARARGLWHNSDGGAMFVAEPGEYRAGAAAGGRFWVRWGRPAMVMDVELDAHEALVWLLCHDLEPARVRCPDCAKRGGPMEWGRSMYSTANPNGAYHGEFLAEQGWTVHSEGVYADIKRRVWVPVTRPCPACAGSGRVSRPWPEVYLDALPRPCKACKAPLMHGTNAPPCPACSELVEREGGGWERRTTGVIPGKPEARAELAAKADQLQDEGDPLGLWLALWLGQLPCEVCDGLGRGFSEDGSQEWNCLECGDGDMRGSGLALGAHDQAMAEAARRARGAP